MKNLKNKSKALLLRPKKSSFSNSRFSKTNITALALVFVGIGGYAVFHSFAAVSITEFPTPSGGPFHITNGPDGNLWYTNDTNNTIGKMTPTGTVTEYPVPTSNASLRKITAGPDGNIWFTEFIRNKIGKITTSGVVTEYSIPTSFSLPVGIVAGPDGNVWFAESLSGKIGRFNPTTQVFTEFSDGITFGANPHGLIVGGDGNLWFTEYGGGDTTPARIARITTAGVVTEFDLVSKGVASDAGLHDLAWGSDGNIWFTEYNKHKIGRMTMDGTVTEFTDGLTPDSAPSSITTGPDGNLWFSESFKDKIGMITTAGVITEYSLSANSSTDGITVGPDNNIWFAARGGGYVGRASLTAPADTTSPSSVSGLTMSANTETSITLSWSAATDNVGVSGYHMYKNNVLDGTTSNLTYAFSGLTCGTSYTLAVEPYDAAGNVHNKADATITSSTAACPPANPADINSDGTVNITDLSYLLSSFGQPTTQCITNTTYRCDLSNPGDNVVNIFDLSILLAKWGSS